MTKTKTEIKKAQVGDVLIYVARYRAKPERTNVDRVTQTGQVYVMADQGQTRFKRHWSGRWEAVNSTSRATLHDNGKETWDKLIQSHKTKVEEDQERQESEKQRIAETKKRNAKEMAETKKAIGELRNVFVLPEAGFYELSKDKRLYVLDLPVKSGRGITFLLATVYVEDYKSWDTEKKTVVNGRGSYLTNDSSGNLSFRDSKDDDALLWELANYLYHRA